MCAAFCRCDEHGAAQQFDQREIPDVIRMPALGIEQLSELFLWSLRSKKASAKARPEGKRPKEERRKTASLQEARKVERKKPDETDNLQPTTNNKFLLLTIYFYNEIDYD